MGRVRKHARLDEKTLKKLSSQYEIEPKVFEKVSPPVLSTAKKLAHGNIHKMTVEPDGSIIIHNNVVW